MTSRASRAVPALALLTAAALGGLAPATASTTEATADARAAARTVYFDMYYQQKVAPKRIFLTASSGPYLKRLDWAGWGKRRTTATGVYVSDCASCLPPARRTAEVTFRKRIYCADERVRTYRRAVVRVSEPDQGYRSTSFRIPMGCP